VKRAGRLLPERPATSTAKPKHPDDGIMLIAAAILPGSSSRDVWTVPIGGGFGKIVHLGKLPINLSFQAFYNVARLEYGATGRL
jgi:hypothetical protein